MADYDETNDSGSSIGSNYEGEERPVGCGGSLAATCLTLILLLLVAIF